MTRSRLGAGTALQILLTQSHKPLENNLNSILQGLAEWVLRNEVTNFAEVMLQCKKPLHN